MEPTSKQHPYLIFMLLLSLFALAALAFETVFPLDEGTREILGVADTVVCVLFFLDFVVSLRQAQNKWRYLVTWGWLDLLSSVPAVEVLRLGRAVRIARIIRVLRGIRAARVLSLFIVERRTQSTLLAATFLSIVLVAVSAIAVLHFEIPVDGNIKTGEDAIWWAMSTITTVGYGDKYPVSPEGRALAIALMVAGVGMFATLSGVLASWFLAPSQAQRDDELTVIRRELAEVKQLLVAVSQQNTTSQ
jgi:voltage-gated potassium channel